MKSYRRILPFLCAAALLAACDTSQTGSLSQAVTYPGTYSSDDGAVTVVAPGDNGTDLQQALMAVAGGRELVATSYLANTPDALAVLQKGSRFRAPKGDVPAVENEINGLLAEGWTLKALEQGRARARASRTIVAWFQRDTQVRSLVTSPLRGLRRFEELVEYAGFELRAFHYSRQGVDTEAIAENDDDKRQFDYPSLVLTSDKDGWHVINSYTDRTERSLVRAVDAGATPRAFGYPGSASSVVWLRKGFSAGDGEIEHEYRVEHSDDAPAAFAERLAPMVANGWEPFRFFHTGRGTVAWLTCPATAERRIEAVAVTDTDEPEEERFARLAARLSTALHGGCRVHTLLHRGKEPMAIVVDRALASPIAPAAAAAGQTGSGYAQPSTTGTRVVFGNSLTLRKKLGDTAPGRELLAFSFNGEGNSAPTYGIVTRSTPEGERFRVVTRSGSVETGRALENYIKRGWDLFDLQYRRTRHDDTSSAAMWLTRSDKRLRFLLPDDLHDNVTELHYNSPEWELIHFSLGGKSRSHHGAVFVQQGIDWGYVAGTPEELEGDLADRIAAGWEPKAFGYNPDANGAAQAALWLMKIYPDDDTEYRLHTAETPDALSSDPAVQQALADGWSPVRAFNGGEGVTAWMQCKSSLRTIVEPEVESDEIALADFETRLQEAFDDDCVLFELVHRGEYPLAVLKPVADAE